MLHGGGDVGLGQQQAVGDASTGVAGWAFRQEQDDADFDHGQVERRHHRLHAPAAQLLHALGPHHHGVPHGSMPPFSDLIRNGKVVLIYNHYKENGLVVKGEVGGGVGLPWGKGLYLPED